MMTLFVVASVSAATRTLQGSKPVRSASRKKRSTISSEIRSQTLSGCPSETDSLVKRCARRATSIPVKLLTASDGASLQPLGGESSASKTPAKPLPATLAGVRLLTLSVPVPFFHLLLAREAPDEI